MSDTQDDWERRLYRRASRLFRLLDVQAPDMVLAEEKRLIVAAIEELEPARLADALVHMPEGIAKALEETEAAYRQEDVVSSEARILPFKPRP
jgi:hypothetical protein